MLRNNNRRRRYNRDYDYVEADYGRVDKALADKLDFHIDIEGFEDLGAVHAKTIFLEGKLELVEALLAMDVDMNYDYGIRCACRNEHVDVVMLLSQNHRVDPKVGIAAVSLLVRKAFGRGDWGVVELILNDQRTPEVVKRETLSQYKEQNPGGFTQYITSIITKKTFSQVSSLFAAIQKSKDENPDVLLEKKPEKRKGENLVEEEESQRKSKRQRK